MAAPARSVHQRLLEEICRRHRDIDLARVALLLAKEQYPQICVEHYLVRLDHLAEEVRGRLADETAPLLVLEELVRVLYQRHGFRGNTEAYEDPRNSFLNDVLDRRTGIPISLAVVVLEVGWRLGLPLEGVNFPHHFLVRFRGDALDLLLDPFEGGRLRFVDEAQGYLDRVYGGRVRLRDAFLREATRLDMLVRMLANLRNLYVNGGDGVRAGWAADRLALLRGKAREEGGP